MGYVRIALYRVGGPALSRQGCTIEPASNEHTHTYQQVTMLYCKEALLGACVRQVSTIEPTHPIHIDSKIFLCDVALDLLKRHSGIGAYFLYQVDKACVWGGGIVGRLWT